MIPAASGDVAASSVRPARTTLAVYALAPIQGLVFVALAIAEAVLAVFVSVAAILALVVVGVFLLPGSLRLLHLLTDRVRRWDADTGGIRIDAHDHPVDQGGTGIKSRVLRTRSTLRDPMAVREFLWSIVDPMVGASVAVTPAALIVFGLFGVVVQPFVWRPIDRAGGSNWYAFIHVDSTITALLGIPLGLLFLAAGFWIGPAALRLHGRWTRLWLRPNSTARLQGRVAELARSRADATDAMASQLRRIERDVHDGAQARLVALGMNLGTAAELFDKDPEAARALLETARDSSSAALHELRDLMRGIHPPVLADRGIADAMRALALDAVIDVDVTARLEGRPEPPIETAVYFAVSELLTNAAKHAKATSISVDLDHHDGFLRCTVEDDGQGGAVLGRGSGLLGVQRRLAQFDGTLRLSSPNGGPTRIMLEIPCALSSPKTSFSSETGCSAPSPNTGTTSSPPSTTDPRSG